MTTNSGTTDGYAVAAPNLTSPGLITRGGGGWVVRLTGRLGRDGYEFLGTPDPAFDGSGMIAIEFGTFAGPGAASTFVQRLAGPPRLGVRYPSLMGSVPRATCSLGRDVDPMAAVRAAASLFFDVEGGGRRIDVHAACETASLTPVMSDPTDGSEYEENFEAALTAADVPPLTGSTDATRVGIRVLSERRMSVTVNHLAQEKASDSQRRGATPTLTYAIIPTLAPRRARTEPDPLRRVIAAMMSGGSARPAPR